MKYSFVDQTRSKPADNNVQRLKQGENIIQLSKSIDFWPIGGCSKCVIMCVWMLSFVKVGVLTFHHILAARLFKNVQSSAQEIMVNNGFWDTVKNCIYNLTRWQRHRGAAEEKYLSE
jgi:hypothetical protein